MELATGVASDTVRSVYNLISPSNFKEHVNSYLHYVASLELQGLYFQLVNHLCHKIPYCILKSL